MSSLDRELTVTFFFSAAAWRKKEESLSLRGLVSRIEKVSSPQKARLPWLKLAKFGDNRLPHNTNPPERWSLRHNANVHAISGIEVDYDQGDVTLERAADTLRAASLAALLYTSPSHTDDAPRWRVLCPLSHDYPPEDRAGFVARLHALFDGKLSRESFVLSQSYYYGSLNRNPSHTVKLIDGDFLDLRSELKQQFFKEPQANSVHPDFSGGVHVEPDRNPHSSKFIEAVIANAIGKVRSASNGQKHYTIRNQAVLLGGYSGAGAYGKEEAVSWLMDALPAAAKDRKAARKTAIWGFDEGVNRPIPIPPLSPRSNGHAPHSATENGINGHRHAGSDPADDDGRPLIYCRQGELQRMALEAEAALLAYQAPIYQRTTLVRPAELEYPAADGRLTHSVVLAPITPPSMLNMLSEAANWKKWDGRANAFVVCDPPSKVVDILLASRGNWKFPVIRGVLTTPTIRHDGSLVISPGYDPASRYYLAFPSDLVVPHIPENPTESDAIESLARLDRLLDSYPFVDDGGVSRSVALAILMTQVLRCGMTVSPLLAVSATAPGSGKSHIIDLANTIPTGRPCPIMGAGKNDEETEKGINANLLSGVTGFSIDNVHRLVDLAVLNIATERPMIGIRLFGTLDKAEVENSVTIYMTGNNLPVVDEQVRRTILCRMDAETECPEQRHFAREDPIKTVLANRGRYIADILLIARAYLVNGTKPTNLRPFGSYQGWSKLVREPLVWLGQPDPVLSQNTTRASDPALTILRDITTAWFGAFQSNPKTLAEVTKFLTETNPDNNASDSQDYESRQRMLEMLIDAFGRGGKIDNSRFGNWLRKYSNRISGGLKFKLEVDEAGRPVLTHQSVRWQVVQKAN